MVLIHTLDGVRGLIETSDTIFLDTETSNLEPWKNGKILAGVSFRPLGKKSYYLPIRHFSDEPNADLNVLEELMALLYGKKLVFHNAKFDLAVLYQEGFTELIEKNIVYDTVVLTRLCYEDLMSYELKKLGVKFIDPTAADDEKELKKYIKANNCLNYAHVPPSIMEPYASKDVELTEGLYRHMMPLIADRDLKELLDLEIGTTKALFYMERDGVKIDRKYVLDQKSAIETVVKALEKEAYDLAGKEFDILSPKQVGEIFREMGVSSSKLTPGGKDSWDKAALQALDHPLAKVIVDYRGYAKLNATYYDNFLNLADKNDVIHCNFNQAGAKTGRFCVAGNTLLETTDGVFRISELDLHKYPNCEILTHRGRYRKILGKCYKGQEEMHRVSFSNGEAITCTVNHQFLAENGWRSLSNLKLGSAICSFDRKADFSIGAFLLTGSLYFKYTYITAIEPVGVQDVWDLEVEDDHSYVAQSVVNHNSSRQPNLQNIPKKGTVDTALSFTSEYSTEADQLDPELVGKVRHSFIPRDGYFFLFTDWSACEPRIMADYAKETDLIRAFSLGLDIHLLTAITAFGRFPSPEEFTTMRNAGKTIGLALIYGVGNAKLATQLGKSIDDAKRMKQAYFSRFRKVDALGKAVEKAIIERGFLRNKWGRRRYLPRELSYVGFNFLIQSVSADVMKDSLVRLQEKLKPYKSRILLSIHDEFISEIAFDERHEVIPIILETMRTNGKLTIPFRVDPTISTTYWDEKVDLECESCSGSGVVINISKDELYTRLLRSSFAQLTDVKSTPCPDCKDHVGWQPSKLDKILSARGLI